MNSPIKWFHPFPSATPSKYRALTCVDKRVSIVSGNGLSPVRRQAISWTNVDLLSIGSSGKLQWNSNCSAKFFIHESVYENVCEMAVILSKGRWVSKVLQCMGGGIKRLSNTVLFPIFPLSLLPVDSVANISWLLTQWPTFRHVFHRRCLSVSANHVVRCQLQPPFGTLST